MHITVDTQPDIDLAKAVGYGEDSIQTVLSKCKKTVV